jgi:hypothetical protein
MILWTIISSAAILVWIILKPFQKTEDEEENPYISPYEAEGNALPPKEI